jgi:hypothetical protein
MMNTIEEKMSDRSREINESLVSVRDGNRLKRILGSIRDVVYEARRVDLRTYEEKESSVIRGELVPAVQKIAERGLFVLAEVTSAFPQDDPDIGLPVGDFYRNIDSSMAGEADSGKTPDLCFIARMEIRTKADALRRSVQKDSEGTWEVLAKCGSIVRRLCKALTAVERSICEVGNLQPELDYVTEIARAVEVRKLYRRFLRDISKAELQSETLEVGERLRRAGNAIARVTGHRMYEALRFSDRYQFHQLHQRIAAWQREDGKSSEAGSRILKDIHAFGELLIQINNRQELQEHDRALINEIWSAILQPDNPQKVLSAEIFQRLQGLLGRDQELDGLIERGSDSFEDWKEPLFRLLQETRPF